MSFTPSTRSQLITRRTYSRPLADTPGPNQDFYLAHGYEYEPWEETCSRVLEHQKWLWERAQGHKLTLKQDNELAALYRLFEDRKALPSGRTLWLGGTPVSKRREATQFNCSFCRVETVHDVVDAFWLLLQGCGVGFEPIMGTLSGFTAPVTVEVRSKPKEHRREENRGSVSSDAYKLEIGDSAEAWAKSIGKLLAMKHRVSRVILDFSNIRPAGIRLKGYGWISSGYEPLAQALEAICGLLSKRAGQLLSRIDILDILNHLGTTLSSRRSAEIALVPFGDPEWIDFARAKKDHWIDKPHRAQSNNSLLFYAKPSKGDLYDIFEEIEKNGGSEPGFINAQAALKRAPWFKGVNPCAEILLGNRSFCK